MINVSGFGLIGNLVASTTFPQGFSLTAFADDGDSLDIPDFNVAATGMGLNGHMLVWNQAAVTDVGINLIPSSQDDVNMSVLVEANRVGLNKRSAKDVITLTVSYPDGSTSTFSGGALVTGSIAKSVSSQQRIRSRNYRFHFEKKTTINEKSQEA